MKKRLLLLPLVSSLTILAACNQAPVSNTASTPAAQAGSPASIGKTIASAKSGDITVTLTNVQGQLKDSDNDFTVEFRNAAGQTVDVGAITMFIDMPAMPPSMPYMKSNVKLVTTNTPGIYQATTNLEMAGTWTVRIAYKGSAGEGKMDFPIQVK